MSTLECLILAIFIWVVVGSIMPVMMLASKFFKGTDLSQQHNIVIWVSVLAGPISCLVWIFVLADDGHNPIGHIIKNYRRGKAAKQKREEEELKRLHGFQLMDRLPRSINLRKGRWYRRG